MEINKQLFEDVLSGKLEGTFVLRNGKTFNSKYLKRSEETFHGVYYCYPYALFCDINDGVLFTNFYTENGFSRMLENSSIDIVDFIPETNMKENELTIEIPEGKIVDWDESKKQNKIVLKNKQLTYKDVCKKLFSKDCYFIDQDGSVEHISTNNWLTAMDKNNATTEHQLECILAKNQLANVAKYLNGGWKPNDGDFVFCLTCRGDLENNLGIGMYYFENYGNQIIFKTQESAQQAIEILGEETVKLALEPLGI